MSEFGKDINAHSRKGVFIPDITVEMLRNAPLEGVEDLMASGEMEDISLPSAQPERKKGEWIIDEKHYKDDEQDFYYYDIRCSECGAMRKIGWADANYCPNCGAEMRGEEYE